MLSQSLSKQLSKQVLAASSCVPSFGLHANFDVENGFMPKEDPLTHLPPAFAEWDDIGYEIPKLLMTEHLGNKINALPDFPVHQLSNQQEIERANVIFSWVAHAYVWQHYPPKQSIPAKIAVPWYDVSHNMLGRPPVLSYASYCLNNWRRIDPNGPIDLGNIVLNQTFWGGADEEWFILIHVAIEERAKKAVAAIPKVLAAAKNSDPDALFTHLTAIKDSLVSMHETLARTPELCDPNAYFIRVRPFIHGWKDNPAMPNGMIYEGVKEYNGKGQFFRGETGSQSAIIPSIDSLLKITHADDPLLTYLLELREYVPPAHRAFILDIAKETNVREFIESHSASHPELTKLYDQTVNLVGDFRTTHLGFAMKYIEQQHQVNEGNPSRVGTGGSPFSKYLRKHRDESRSAAISP